MLEKMIMDYKRQGSRVDEVLFQEVMKVIGQHQKSEALLKRLKIEMGSSADEDVRLWLKVKRHLEGVE